jgi:filamentous hemagglutinin family protein
VAGSSGGPGASFHYNPGGTRLNVNQTAQRVVIDWNSFNIGAGDTVNFNQGAANWIAFNIVNPGRLGVSPLSTIAGNLNARGGVWLFSTGGILFGPGAVVNVGSFAGITGPLSVGGGIGQLLNPDNAGLFTVTLDAPAAGAGERITLSPGARITATSGYVILQGQAMVQNGAVSAFDGVDYSLGEAGQIQFTTAGAGQQLQSVSLTPIPGRDRPSLTHGGTTSGAWVEIEAPGGALQAGYHGVINLGGTIDATGVKPGTGDGVVLLIGDDEGPAFPGYNGTSLGLDASAGAITAAQGLEVVSDSARLGPISAGGGVDVETFGAITATGPVSAGGPILLASNGGAVNVDANLTSDAGVTAAGDLITVGPKVTIQADALGDGAGDLSLQSQGDVAADPTSTLLAGASPAAPTSNVTVRAGLGAGGGNIALGAVEGQNVFVQSQSNGFAKEGSIVLAGNVTGPASVRVLTNDIAAAGQPAGTFQVLGAVTSGGLVDLENLGPGTFTVGPTARVTSTGGQVFLYAGGDALIDGQVTGVSLLDHTVGALTIAAGASVAVTGTAAAPVAPEIPAGSEFVRASGLNLAASQMTIAGTVNAGAANDIYIEVLGGGPATVGGTGGAAGFDLTDASFQNLHGRDVIVMGGPGEAEGPGSNLTVGDLTLNSANLAALWLGTASGRDISITGQVSPVGAVALQVGLVRQEGTGGLDGFTPGAIDISGALGSAAAPMGEVTLIARNDILIGDPAFIAAAGADPAFDSLRRSHNFPDFATNYVFITGTSLQMAAQGRIVQENTGRNSLTFAGIDITAPTLAAPLVFVPAALEGQTIGGAWVANYGAGPTGIALFGTVLVNGVLAIDDVRAAVIPGLLQGSVDILPLYAINSCVFADVCPSPIPILTFQPPPGTTPSPPGVPGVLADLVTTDPVAAMTAGGVTLAPDDDRLGAANPVTESGNGDLTVGPRADCPPTGPDKCPTP